MRRVGRLLALLLALAAAPAAAQDGPPPRGTPVLVIDQERLFTESLFGERVSAEIERRSEALAAENREIEAALIDEERALTERRGETPPEEFRRLADAFDEKVQRLREQQDRKARELSDLREQAREAFAQQIVPVLSELVRDRGGAVLLERRSVFLSADAIDITDEAIERLDEAVGSGEITVMPRSSSPGSAPTAEDPAAGVESHEDGVGAPGSVGEGGEPPADGSP